MQEVSFQCSPIEAKEQSVLKYLITNELNISEETSIDFRWKKRSIDARKKAIKINCVFEVEINGQLPENKIEFEFKSVRD